MIHRDVKPSNILVAEYDGVPTPKVIDFGVAKATRQALTDMTLETVLGAVIGTPLYMAPEQAEPDQVDIDTRADVYALGVLLYELLAGSTPLVGSKATPLGMLEFLRQVREEEPPAPSLRLGQSADLAPIAARRGTDPNRLKALVKGDLDGIAMKALEKDRSRRYETVAALARDVERHLADEPVEAGRPKAVYRLRKFARKHRGAIRAVSAFLLLLVAATAVSVVLAVRAARAEADARREAAVAGAVNEFFNDHILNQANPNDRDVNDPDIRLRTVLDRASSLIPDRFAEMPRVEAAIRISIGRAYQALDQPKDAELHLRRAHDLMTRESGGDDEQSLDALFAIGELVAGRGDFAEARRIFREVYDGRLRLLGDDAPKVVQVMNSLGTMMQFTGDAAEALPLHIRALGSKRSDPLASRSKIRSLDLIGMAYQYLKDYEKAAKYQLQALELSKRDYGPTSFHTIDTMNNLGLDYVLGNKPDPAEPVFIEAIAIAEKTLPKAHSMTLVLQGNLARVYLARKEFDRALALFRETAEAAEASLGLDDRTTLVAWTRVAQFSADQDPAEAERLIRKVLPGLEGITGAESTDTMAALSVLGTALVSRGDYAGAESLQIRILDARRKKNAPKDDDFATMALIGLGEARLRLGDPGRAEPDLCQGLALLEAKRPDARRLATARMLLGECLIARARPVEAEPYLLAGHKSAVRLKAGPVVVAKAIGLLIGFYESTGKPDQVARWRDEQARAPVGNQPGRTP